MFFATCTPREYTAGVYNKDGESVVHIWDGSNIVMDVDGDDGAVIDRYVRGITLLASDVHGYYLFNAHGDVVQLADGSGAVTKDYNYDAFGVQVDSDGSMMYTQSGDALFGDTDSNPWRYCGEYFDTETNTIYLRARYYNPAFGRFVSEDTVRSVSRKTPNEQEIVDPLSLNLYTYTYNNPVMHTDPSGHVILVDDVIILLILGGVTLTTTAAWLTTTEGQRAVNNGVTVICDGVSMTGRELANAVQNLAGGMAASIKISEPRSSRDGIPTPEEMYAAKATAKESSSFAVSSTGGGASSGDPNGGKGPKRNWESVKEKWLERKLQDYGLDPHSVKQDVLGSKAKISHYDIKVDKVTGQLGVFSKKGILIRILEIFIK